MRSKSSVWDEYVKRKKRMSTTTPAKKPTTKKPTTKKPTRWKNDTMKITPKQIERKKKLGLKFPPKVGRREASYILYIGDPNLAKKVDAKKGPNYCKKKLKEMGVKRTK